MRDTNLVLGYRGLSSAMSSSNAPRSWSLCISWKVFDAGQFEALLILPDLLTSTLIIESFATLEVQK